MTTATATLTAREYLRVSLDASGRERSIGEQHTENEREAERAGWALGEPYADNSVSASRYTTKTRGGWAELIADLEAERFGADVLILWESSRGSRRVAEWVELLELLERRAVRVHVTSHGRTYDPSRPRDRRSLLEDAVDSEYESGKMSDRLRRSSAARAAEGAPHGRTPLGYRRVYDPATGKLVRQEPDPETAPLIRELYTRLRQGHSLRGIAADWRERGIVNPSGTPYSPQHLRTLALTRAYAGERTHAPKAATRQERQRTATVVPAQWPALVDRETFLAVQRMLTAPERRTSRPGRAKHLLSMIAVCDVCSGPLSVAYRRGNATYKCRDRSCVHVNKDDLDALATEAMLGYLSRPDNVERLTADDATDERVEAARAEVAELRAELDDLADRVGSGELSAALAGRAEPRILARLEAATKREAGLAAPGALGDLVAPGEDVRLRWDAAPVAAKREVARMLLSPDVLGELRVARTANRRAPVEDRVVWRA